MNSTLQDLSGRTALVIGATEGIGRATALAFAAAGANVFAAGLGAARGRSLEEEIRSAGRVQAAFMEADVTREADVQAVVEEAARRFGRIHAAVNNAGTEGRFGPVHEATTEDFDRLINVNLRGVWHGLKHQIPHMLAHGGGAIVNTASSAGIQPIANIALYSASKHAVIGLTKAAALELARSNIRVNCVAPGPVNTGLLHRMVAGNVEISTIAESVPMGRISEPEEIARAIVWLCSDAASYVTGHTLAIDGGLTVG
ncbi:MAG: glucose 1-dehydrogenase [Steroidobacteraceae bacterium]|nr:glucose 1-dehydrogenase [Steroidobacteraceae bacterium]